MQVLRSREVRAMLGGICNTTLYERMNPKSRQYDPTFPKPIKLGIGSKPQNGWYRHELEAYLKGKQGTNAETVPLGDSVAPADARGYGA